MPRTLVTWVAGRVTAKSFTGSSPQASLPASETGIPLSLSHLFGNPVATATTQLSSNGLILIRAVSVQSLPRLLI